MARYTKSGSISTVQQIDAELEKIEVAQAELLSRTGDTPNQMEDTLDMNSQRLINLPEPLSGSEPLRLSDGLLLSSTREGGSTISEEPPVLKAAGDRWTRCSDMKAFLWYEDGDSGQWIEDRPSYGIDTIQNLSLPYVFDTVADMTSSVIVFPVGKKLSTKGYYAKGDGGNGDYIIVAAATGTADGGSYHNLTGGGQAELVAGDAIGLKQFGAKADGVTDDTSAVQAAVDMEVHIAAELGVFLVSTVTLKGNTSLSGQGKRATVFKIKSGGNTGLTYSGGVISEGQLSIKNVGFEAQVLGDGYGLTITNLAFVRTENTRFVNLARGESYTDVLISRFVESEYKRCTVGSWVFGNLGANINIYEHPLSRNCDVGMLFDSVGGESCYGNTILNGDFEYNKISLDIKQCGQTPHRLINTTLEGDTASAESNKIRVTGDGKLDFKDNLVGTFNDDGLPAVFTTDSDGVINYLGTVGKQTASLRPIMPQKGHYVGSSVTIDNVASDVPYELAKSIIKRDSVRATSFASNNAIHAFLTGAVSAGVQRVSSFSNTGGWEEGASVSVTSPVGDTSAFEVTTAARMSADTPQSGDACIQMFVQCARGDAGSYAVAVLEKSNNATLTNMVVNFNGVSGWQLVSIPIDLATTTTGIRLVLPALSGIRIWGQQISTGTAQAVPLLPLLANNKNGLRVDDYKTITPLYRSAYFEGSQKASNSVFTSQDLVKSDDAKTGLGMAFEVIIQEYFGSASQTRTYLVNLSYGVAFSASSVTETGYSYSGTVFASRIAITATSDTASSNKGLRFTTTDFINEVVIKVRALV